MSLLTDSLCTDKSGDGSAFSSHRQHQPMEKCFDCSRAASGQWAHSDWLTVQMVRIMVRIFILFFQIFHPETTDIYDKKNMPRAIYCVHALRSVSACGSVWPPVSLRLCIDWLTAWLTVCLSVYSIYMYRQGLAPQIQDLYGKVNFTGDFTVILALGCMLSFACVCSWQ